MWQPRALETVKNSTKLSDRHVPVTPRFDAHRRDTGAARRYRWIRTLTATPKCSVEALGVAGALRLRVSSSGGLVARPHRVWHCATGTVAPRLSRGGPLSFRRGRTQRAKGASPGVSLRLRCLQCRLPAHTVHRCIASEPAPDSGRQPLGDSGDPPAGSLAA